MPEIFEISFPLRYYECDILGHLNNASYFKFMQEAAFAASASVGYGRARYTQMDRAWIIHESKINYLKPVYYGQELVIRTWVSDMRRVRSLRQYEFLVGDTLVAQAYTDWVFLDRTSMRPTEIPEEVQMAYLPEKLPQNGQDREKYPRTPIPAAEVFIHPKRVEWRDVDPWGHVNNSVYLSYIEDCGMQIAAAYDWPWQRMEEHNFGIIARQHHIEYKAQAHLDDQLLVHTWIGEVRRSTARRFYAIYNACDQQLITRCHSLYVWVDLDSMRPIRIPEKFLRSFRNNISPETKLPG